MCPSSPSIRPAAHKNTDSLGKRVVIHIGFGKTGTTSIQNALSRSSFSHGVSYPISGRWKNQNIITVALRSRDNLQRGLKEYVKRNQEVAFKEAEKQIDIIKNSIKKNDITIISGEFFSQLSVSEINKMIDVINIKNCNITTIAYVRNYMDMFISRTQQKLKASSEIIHPGDFMIDYYGIINKWDKISNSMIVREFNRDSLYNNNVVEDFFHLIFNNFNINPNFRLPDTGDELNESISSEGMQLLWEFRSRKMSDIDNIFHDKTNKLLKTIQKIENENKEFFSKPKLNRKHYDALRKSVETDSAKMMIKYGMDLLNLEKAEDPYISKKYEVKEMKDLFENYSENKKSIMYSLIIHDLL